MNKDNRLVQVSLRTPSTNPPCATLKHLPSGEDARLNLAPWSREKKKGPWDYLIPNDIEGKFYVVLADNSGNTLATSTPLSLPKKKTSTTVTPHQASAGQAVTLTFPASSIENGKPLRVFFGNHEIVTDSILKDFSNPNGVHSIQVIAPSPAESAVVDVAVEYTYQTSKGDQKTARLKLGTFSYVMPLGPTHVQGRITGND